MGLRFRGFYHRPSPLSSGTSNLAAVSARDEACACVQACACACPHQGARPRFCSSGNDSTETNRDCTDSNQIRQGIHSQPETPMVSNDIALLMKSSESQC